MAVLKNIRLIGAVAAGAGWYVSPHGYNLYRTGPGDTFASLAATYLGDASRSDEIYNDQSADWRAQRGNDPSNLETGAELYMPEEAISSAEAAGLVAAGGLGEPPTAARSGKTEDPGGTDVLVTPKPSNVVPIRPAPAPTPTPTPAPGTSFLSQYGKAILITSGLSIVVGGAIAVVAHKKHAHRKNPRRRGKRGLRSAWAAAEG